MLNDSQIFSQLNNCLSGTDFRNLGQKYTGKVRDVYRKNGQIIIVTTDRLSAFDKNICLIPFKGQVLNDLTKFWFQKTKDIFPNYVIEYPDPNVIVGDECKPLKVEMVVRGYLTGSAYRAYEAGERNFGGNILPDGLKKDHKFETPILTPTTKAEHGAHDEPATRDELIKKGILSREDWDKIASAALKIFSLGQKIAAEQGVILVDTKYEFGINKKNEIVLIDEIHTPDSSRFWKGENHENINKEYLRQWLAERGFMGDGEVPEVPPEVKVETAKRYMEAYELITGEKFKAESGNPLSRIEKNLSKYF